MICRSQWGGTRPSSQAPPGPLNSSGLSFLAIVTLKVLRHWDQANHVFKLTNRYANGGNDAALANDRGRTAEV